MMFLFLLFLFASAVNCIVNDVENTYIIQVTPNFDQRGYDCMTFDVDTIICIIDRSDLNKALMTEEVLHIEKDAIATGTFCQEARYIWHLNAVTEFKFPPMERYAYDTPQPPTEVYVLDSWVDTDHKEFEGRASRGPAFESGQNFHGTHVSSLIAGKTYGVNKKAKIISVQCLDRNARGAWSSIIKAMDYVARRPKKTIVNISISGSKSDAVNKALNAMVKQGWKVIVAAGNDGRDACLNSPASAEQAFTVGAFDSNKVLSDFSNYGKCVDILAPGSGIIGACPGNQLCFSDGTSMAAPLVAGVLSLHPEWSVADLVNYSRSGIQTRSGTTNKAVNARPKATCNKMELLIEEFGLPSLLVQ